MYDLTDSNIQGAVIVAWLQLNKGKATLSDFNKIYRSLGNSNLKRKDYDNLFETMKNNEGLYNSLFDKVYNGELDLGSIPSHTEFDPEDSQQVTDVLTTYNKQHQVSLDYLREYNKSIKNGTTLELLLDQLEKSLVKELNNLPKISKNAFEETNHRTSGITRKHLIVCFADWHIGALVDNVETGGYSYSLLKQRLNTFYGEIERAIEEQHISDIHVYHIGDLIEHISMRNVNQAFETEFTMADQIAKGIALLAEFLNKLSLLGKVHFGCVGGNHDRLNGNKKDQVYNDSAMYIALSQLLLLKSLGQFPNVDIEDNRDDIYSFEDQVGSKTIMVVHGDREKKQNDVKIPSHIKDHNINYLIMGHIHTTRIIQEDYSRFSVYVGSTMGANNYSKQLNMPTTAPSQMLMILDDDHDSPIFQPVFL